MLSISAKKRSEKGKKNSQLRNRGLVPAVLYGHNTDAVALALKANEFEKIYQEAGESSLIKLKIDADETKEERMVFIYDIQKHPVSDRIIHADFYQAKMDEAMQVEVPLVFNGEAPAVKDLGGVLVKNLYSVEVEALPQDIPHEIEIDIVSLKTFEDSIRVKDLQVSDKVTILADAEEGVVSVNPPRSDEELEELEETPTESVEDVEVEKKGKEEDEESSSDTEAKDSSGEEEQK